MAISKKIFLAALFTLLPFPGPILDLHAAETTTQGAPIGSEKVFQAAGNLPIKVKVVGPVQAETDLQIICLFKHNTAGDKYIEALDDLNKRFKLSISELRNRGEFEGNELETILLNSPPAGINAKRLLIIGLGEETKLSPETLRRAGIVALRTSSHLNATRVAFAPVLRDQGNSTLPVGIVAESVLSGLIEAYNTDQRLQKENLKPKYQIEEFIFEAGPKYFNEVQKTAEQAIQRTSEEIIKRPSKPYMLP